MLATFISPTGEHTEKERSTERSSNRRPSPHTAAISSFSFPPVFHSHSCAAVSIWSRAGHIVFYVSLRILSRFCWLWTVRAIREHTFDILFFFSAREQKLRKLFRKERREEKNQLTNIAMPCMEPVWKCKRQIISDCDRSRKTRKHRFHVSLSSWKKMMWN